MSVGAQAPDLSSWLNEFLDAFAGVEITKETIDALAMSLAVYQTQHAMQQVEVSMARAGVDMQQIELEKARLQFEMEEMLPFKQEELDARREQMLMENEFAREKMENDRIQSRHETMRAAIGESTARASQAMAYNQIAAQQPANRNAQPYYHSSPYRASGNGQQEQDAIQRIMSARGGRSPFGNASSVFGQFG